MGFHPWLTVALALMLDCQSLVIQRKKAHQEDNVYCSVNNGVFSMKQGDQVICLNARLNLETQIWRPRSHR